MWRFIIIIPLLGFSFIGISQESNSFPDTDSVLIYVYNGVSIARYGKPRPYLSFPKDINPGNIVEYLLYYKRTKQHNLEVERKKKAFFGEIDTSKEFTHYSLLPINEKRKFNPTIVWKSKRKISKSQIGLLERYIYIKESKESPQVHPIPSKCYSPKHTLLFYKDGIIIKHYDICFACNQVKENGLKSIYPVNFEGLKKLFFSIGLPINGDELSQLIREHN